MDIEAYLEATFHFSVYLDDYDIKSRMGNEGIDYDEMDGMIKVWLEKGWLTAVQYNDKDVRHIYFKSHTAPRIL